MGPIFAYDKGYATPMTHYKGRQGSRASNRPQCIQRAFPSNCFGNSTDIIASEQAINRLSRDFCKSRSDLAEIPSEQGIIREWVRAAPVITANNVGTTVYNLSIKCTVG